MGDEDVGSIFRLLGNVAGFTAASAITNTSTLGFIISGGISLMPATTS